MFMIWAGGLGRITLYLALLFLLKFRGCSSYLFKDACELHEKNDKYKDDNTTPSSILPQIISEEDNSSWLQVPLKDIEKAYQKGLDDCMHALSNMSFSTNHAPITMSSPNLYDKFGQQSRCRGRDSLFALTGILIWPFGPLDNCKIYSFCWFGLLSCGKQRNMSLNDFMDSQDFKAVNLSRSEPQPTYIGWSIKAVQLQMRLVGPEIVVPQQRVLGLQSIQSDIIISQYSLTLPGTFSLEIRHEEIYPALLFNWNRNDFFNDKLYQVGSVFLGESESRCKPFTRCMKKNRCCNCDAKSSVINTPIAVHADESQLSSRCPNLKAKLKQLELCPTSASIPRGRWINTKQLCENTEIVSPFPIAPGASSRTRHSVNISATLPKEVNKHPTKTHQKLAISATKARHIYRGPNRKLLANDTLEMLGLSGDYCIVHNNDVEEEEGSRNWVYSPYSCRYHIYPRETALQCLRHLNITFILIDGDSIARELLLYLISYVGVSKTTTAAQLKNRTNVDKETMFGFSSSTRELSVYLNYYWSFEEKMYHEKQLQDKEIPDLFITNNALAHEINYYRAFNQNMIEKQWPYWLNRSETSLPRYRFFQTGREIQGRRDGGLSGDVFRSNSELLSSMFVDRLGFKVLDEFAITSGRIDSYIADSDGLHFVGTKRQMEVISLFNMLCNDWLKEVEATT